HPRLDRTIFCRSGGRALRAELPEADNPRSWRYCELLMEVGKANLSWMVAMVLKWNSRSALFTLLSGKLLLVPPPWLSKPEVFQAKGKARHSKPTPKKEPG